jgi:hypothetical protein
MLAPLRAGAEGAAEVAHIGNFQIYFVKPFHGVSLLFLLS